MTLKMMIIPKTIHFQIRWDVQERDARCQKAKNNPKNNLKNNLKNNHSISSIWEDVRNNRFPNRSAWTIFFDR